MRRSRLPRIRLKALEAPDLRDIGRKLPHRMDGEGLDAVGVVLGTPLAEQSLLCAAMPASGRIRASSTSWGDRGRSRPAHVDQLSGRCRPADRTDDYSAADFVISEALQQTAFDEIRHGVLSGWTASARNRTPYPATGFDSSSHPPQAGFREFLLKPSLFVMRRSVNLLTQ